MEIFLKFGEDFANFSRSAEVGDGVGMESWYFEPEQRCQLFLIEFFPRWEITLRC